MNRSYRQSTMFNTFHHLWDRHCINRIFYIKFLATKCKILREVHFQNIIRPGIFRCMVMNQNEFGILDTSQESLDAIKILWIVSYPPSPQIKTYTNNSPDWIPTAIFLTPIRTWTHDPGLETLRWGPVCHHGSTLSTTLPPFFYVTVLECSFTVRYSSFIFW